jgi:putative SOS response-associated peptidase YedK
MCYHIQTPSPEELEDEQYDEPWMKNSVFAADYMLNKPYEKLYHTNGFNHDAIPVMTAENPGRLQLFRWGLIPTWAKNAEQARELENLTLNATCEGIFDKPSFRGSAYHQRCVIVVNGFFENRHEGKKKYPYFVRLKNKRLFFLGGLYSKWTDTDSGEVLHTCAIITTPANPLMAKVHNSKLRMPLIIAKEMLNDWLNPEASKEAIVNMMRPFDENLMEAVTVSPLINNSRTRNTNVPEVTEPAVYPELQMLDAMF